MFGWRRYIRLLRQVDGLCFERKAGVKLILFGKPAYKNEAKVPGDPLGKEWYIVPIFCKYYSNPDLLRFVIHEVRHRVQWNHPKMRLLTVEDAPEELREQVRDIENHVNRVDLAREIDAEIIEHLALPLFSSKSKCAFLELMFGKAKPPKES